jgi:hypothetical protein
MRKLNIVAAIVMIALGVLIIQVSGSFPAIVGTLGPNFFPRMLAGLLIAFSAAILIIAWRQKDDEPIEPPQKSTLFIFASLVIYILILPYLGFLAATPLFLLLSGFLLAEDIRKWWKKILVSSVVSTGSLYYLFAVLLNVPLP